MADFSDGNFYYLEKVKMGQEYHVVLYKAVMDTWEAREAFMTGLQDGIVNRKLILGIENDGERIPIFRCDEGKFYIPELNKDKLGQHAVTLMMELSGQFGIKEAGKYRGFDVGTEQEQDYDIRISETLSKVVTVRAKSMELALSEAHDNYSDAKSEYVLDYNNLRDVNLSMAGIHQVKQRSVGGR